MTFHAFFRTLILSSVASTALSFSAVAIGKKDFKNVGLSDDWKSTSKDTRNAIKKSQDVEDGLKAARKIEELTADSKHETSQNFLRQILKVEEAYTRGNPEQQDGEALSGFGVQIDKIFVFSQLSAKIFRDFSDKRDTMTSEEQVRLAHTANWISVNFHELESARKTMARAFFLRRVGYNSHHKRRAMESAWGALVKFKKMDSLLNTLDTLGADQEMRQVYDITAETRPEDIVLTRKQLDNSPPYLLEGFPEFQVPESTRYSLLQLQELKYIYLCPFSTLWTGDNQEVLNTKKAFRLSQIQALRDLGMDAEADIALGKEFELQVRQKILNEIMARALGHLQKDTDKIPEIQKEIKWLGQSIREHWIQHALGRPLNSGGAFPNQERFNSILNHLHFIAAMHFVFENNQLDEDSARHLYESTQVRLSEICLRNQKLYNNAQKGNLAAFSTVCSWAKHIDESQTQYFALGDREFFDQFDVATASSKDKENFEKIIKGIYTVLGQKELKNHPEYVVWKLATEKDRTPEEIQHSLLMRIKGYERIIKKEWLSTQNPGIKPLPLDVNPKDRGALGVWENAYNQLQQEGTQSTEQSMQLHRIVASPFPYEQALKALDQHGKKQFFYSIVGGVQGCLQSAQGSQDGILRLLGDERPFLSQMMQCMDDTDFNAAIEDEPHMRSQWELIQKIWGYLSNDKLDIHLHANDMFALAKQLSPYRMPKDLRYSQALVKLWWDKRPNAVFFQDEKRMEDDLLFHQFIDTALRTDLPTQTLQALRLALWTSAVWKEKLQDYL